MDFNRCIAAMLRRGARVLILLSAFAPLGCLGHDPWTGADPHSTSAAAFDHWKHPPEDVPSKDDKGFDSKGNKAVAVIEKLEKLGKKDDDKSSSDGVTLPLVVQWCVLSNLHLQADAEKIQQARADYWTDSLIPNTSLFTDYQLIPLQAVNVNNQAGPPQFDAFLTIPLDWCLFGKRVAAMEASRFGIEVSNAEYADKIRRKVNEAVLAFYDLLEAQELAELAKLDRLDLERISEIVKKQVAAGAAGAVEIDRIGLAVLDSRRELRKREAAVAAARARLKPLIGRTALDPDFEIKGTLRISKAAPALSLPEALALAERNRPDLLADQFSIQQSQSAIRRERKKAHPTLTVSPGYDYQNQNYQNGYRDAHLFSIGLTTTLPVTDRNQGNIAKAMSQLRENELLYQADLADIRAEVEQVVIDYRNAFTAITAEDPATLEAAKSLRERTEAAYKAGARSLLELLDAQRAYRDRFRGTISNQADYWRAIQKLHAAIGVRVLPEEREKVLPPAKP